MIDWVKSVAIKQTLCVLLHLRASQAKSPFPEATILSLPQWAPHLIHIIPVTSAYQDFQPHLPLISHHVFHADVTPPLLHVLPGLLLFIINPASLLRSPRRFFVFVQNSAPRIVHQFREYAIVRANLYLTPRKNRLRGE
ncbi:hypothetical protein VNO80_28872 [Phaseolus coccineus]|uniref:Uncharacterized protein n=1 Tax=Phaseolus coccineus TaxID=3886 RepID=A0AAN9LD87_PHACN